MQIVCNKDTKRADIIKLIRHIMIDYDIKNNDLIDKLGMTKQTVSNLLSPTYRPDASITIDTLVSICDALDCDMTISIDKRDKHV